MEFDNTLAEIESKSYRHALIVLAVLIAFVVSLQFWGTRVRRTMGAPESSGREQAIKSGDLFAKCDIAASLPMCSERAIKSYKQAMPWPSAHRRLGILMQFHGKSGLDELKQIDSPKATRGVDLDKKQIEKLHREKQMWLKVYGPERLTESEAKRYAADVRKLNLGPLKEVAVAQVYQRAGLAQMAKSTLKSVRGEYRASLAALGFLFVVLAVGGLAGIGIAVVFLAMTLPRMSCAPLSRLRPSVLVSTFVVYLASYIVISAAAGALVDTADGGPALSGIIELVWLIASAAAAYTIGLAALMNRTYIGENWREIGYRTVSAGRDLLWGGAGYLASLPFLAVAAIVTAWLMKTVFRHFPTPEQPFGDMVSNGSTLEVILTFFAASVVAPIVEETFFRGVLYSAFRGKMKIWPSIALTSGIFAVIHPLPGGFLPIFTLACVLALLRERSGSLLPCIVCHSLYNTIGLIVMTLAF